MTAGSELATAAAARPGLMQAVAEARQTVAFLTELPVDAVSACRPAAEGWVVEVEVIESPARLGDNDLIARFEVTLDAEARVTGLSRLCRYHREDTVCGGGE